MTEKPRAPWLAIILVGVLAFLVSLVITAATVAGYAVILGIKAQGAPDPDKISAFTSQYVPYFAPIVLSLLVVIAARWVMRRARSRRTLHGVLVGVVAGLLTLVFVRRPGWDDLIGLLLPPLAGWLGAVWARSGSAVTR